MFWRASGLFFAEFEQRIHIGALRSRSGGERSAEVHGGVGTFAEAEEQNAQICRGVLMRGSEQERAPEGAFGDAELNDGPIVPEVGGFALQDGAREERGGFGDAAFEKEGDGTSSWAEGFRLGNGMVFSSGILKLAPGFLGKLVATDGGGSLEIA